MMPVHFIRWRAKFFFNLRILSSNGCTPFVQHLTWKASHRTFATASHRLFPLSERLDNWLIKRSINLTTAFHRSWFVSGGVSGRAIAGIYPIPNRLGFHPVVVTFNVFGNRSDYHIRRPDHYGGFKIILRPAIVTTYFEILTDVIVILWCDLHGLYQ